MQKTTFPCASLKKDLPKEVYSGAGHNVPEANGEDVWELPIPATFIVDRDGVVKWASVDPNYTKRPEPSELVRIVKELYNA
jgi:peroxiredoxin